MYKKGKNTFEKLVCQRNNFISQKFQIGRSLKKLQFNLQKPGSSSFFGGLSWAYNGILSLKTLGFAEKFFNEILAFQILSIEM